MASKIHEEVLNDERTFMLSDFDVRGESSDWIFVCYANQWEAAKHTEKAAFVKFAARELWIPKSAMGFTPSGDLWIKYWFYEKERLESLQ